MNSTPLVQIAERTRRYIQRGVDDGIFDPDLLQMSPRETLWWLLADGDFLCAKRTWPIFDDHDAQVADH